VTLLAICNLSYLGICRRLPVVFPSQLHHYSYSFTGSASLRPGGRMGV